MNQLFQRDLFVTAGPSLSEEIKFQPFSYGLLFRPESEYTTFYIEGKFSFPNTFRLTLNQLKAVLHEFERDFIQNGFEIPDLKTHFKLKEGTFENLAIYFKLNFIDNRALFQTEETDTTQVLIELSVPLKADQYVKHTSV